MRIKADVPLGEVFGYGPALGSVAVRGLGRDLERDLRRVDRVERAVGQREPISLDALVTRRHHDEPRFRYTGPRTPVPVFRG